MGKGERVRGREGERGERGRVRVREEEWERGGEGERVKG